MKTIVAIAIVLGGLAVTVHAQDNAVDAAVLKRAEQMRNQNDATQRQIRQDDASSQSGSAPAPVNVAPPPQRANSRELAVAQLKKDIAAVRSKGEATPEMKTQFARDLMSASLGDNQASLATLNKFSDALLPVLASKSVTDTADSKLMSDMMIALNSYGLSSDMISSTADGLKAALENAGADPKTTGAVADELRAIGADVAAGTK